MSDLQSMEHDRKEFFNDIQRGIQIALGEKPADILLRNVNLVNVFTEEIYQTDILISNDKVVALLEPGTGQGDKVLDCKGLYAVPGLIDGHVHIESHALSLRELTRLLVPKGVTTLLADPHEIANVSGMEGIRVLLQDSEKFPLRVFLQIPARVPTAPGVETTGGVIGLKEVEEMLEWETAISLGELDPSKIVPPIPEYINKIHATKKARLIVNGHAAELTGRHLNAYSSAGIFDDHECVTAEGTIERARLGMTTIAREGTLTQNLEAIIEAVTKNDLPTSNIIMCTDDKLPHEVVAVGDIDYNVRFSIQKGIQPIKAIQMATINSAQHFHLEDRVGSIAPGRLADIVLLSNLEEFKVKTVIVGGKVVAEGGNLCVDLPKSEFPEWAINSVHLERQLKPEDFLITSEKEVDRVKVQAIDISKFFVDFTKRPLLFTVQMKDGTIVSDPKNDLLKIAVVERHKNTGNIGLGFVYGFGLNHGALASSVSHDHHNIVVIGTNDADMAAAVNHLHKIQGGFCLIKDNEVLADVPLQFGGLMSIEPYELVVEKLNNLDQAVWKLGCKLKSPIMMLLGISLPTIPEIGITDLGIIRVSEINRVPEFTDLIIYE